MKKRLKISKSLMASIIVDEVVFNVFFFFSIFFLLGLLCTLGNLHALIFRISKPINGT